MIISSVLKARNALKEAVLLKLSAKMMEIVQKVSFAQEDNVLTGAL